MTLLKIIFSAVWIIFAFKVVYLDMLNDPLLLNIHRHYRSWFNYIQQMPNHAQIPLKNLKDLISINPDKWHYEKQYPRRISGYCHCQYYLSYAPSDDNKLITISVPFSDYREFRRMMKQHYIDLAKNRETKEKREIAENELANYQKILEDAHDDVISMRIKALQEVEEATFIQNNICQKLKQEEG